MAELVITDLTKRYNDFVAVSHVSLSVKQGEFISLLGPSGCGKTSILRMVAGLVEPDAGVIRIGGSDVTWRAVHKRNIGLVFQSYALFPHMSVFENVAFGLRQRGIGGDELSARVGETLELVRLTGLDLRFPRELSGGQQQRVALARAIAPRPALLLLDEPLSNLDAKLRDTMRIELRLLQRELGITTVFVTHDQEEALTMSDRICVLHAGQMQQIGSPRAVYNHPSTPFVAEFFGRSNTLKGRLLSLSSPARIAIDGGTEISATAIPQGAAVGDQVRVTIRRESLSLVADGTTQHGNCFTGKLKLSSFAGNTLIHVVQLRNGIELSAEIQAGRNRESPPAGTSVYLSVNPEDIIVMAQEQE